MENTIFEIIQASKTQFEELKKEKTLRYKQYQEELENQYIEGALLKYGITKEDSIKIKLNDVPTINKIYYKNIKFFRNLARWYCYGQYKKHMDVEDIINQIYIDLRYYDYTSEKTFKKGLYITCRTTNNGGYIFYKSWREEKKASMFLQDEIFSHNSKIDNASSLMDILSADENKTNPEKILIEEEERKNEKEYKQAMIEEIISLLPNSQRQYFMDIFGEYKNE